MRPVPLRVAGRQGHLRGEPEPGVPNGTIRERRVQGWGGGGLGRAIEGVRNVGQINWRSFLYAKIPAERKKLGVLACGCLCCHPHGSAALIFVLSDVRNGWRWFIRLCLHREKQVEDSEVLMRQRMDRFFNLWKSRMQPRRCQLLW